MKLLLLICLFACCGTVTNAQDFTDYAYIDSKALRMPDDETYSTTSIANYIQGNFNTDKDKIRAIYAWVTHNINYNKDSMYYSFWGEDPERKLSSVLKTRKGVCENFASLLTRIAAKCGIPSHLVNGYTKMTGTVKWNGHGWTAVYINNEWLLCDPTWDAGFTANTNYFLIQPDQFIETHMPFDPLWQLLEYPISHKEFRQGFTKGKKEERFNYVDSIKNYFHSDTLQQMESISRRMKQAGLENEDLRTWYAYNEMKIFIVNQEKDMNVFNSAVADLNKAKKIFNDFIQFRNNHFQPAKTDAAISTLFDSVQTRLSAAYKKMDGVGTKIENFQYDTDGLKINLDALSARVKEQQVFLKRYFASSIADREKLLYQQSFPH
jgi:Transglutaminase-like superfamily